MARPAAKHPTDAELEVLTVMWREGESTLRQVQEGLPQRLTRAAVHARLEVMVNKGLIKSKYRSKGLGGTLYRPVGSREGVLAAILRHVRQVFGGSSQFMLQGLLGGGKVDEEDLEGLRKVLRDHGKAKGTKPKGG